MKHSVMNSRIKRIEVKTKPRTLPWLILLKPGESPPAFPDVPGENVLILRTPKNYVPSVSAVIAPMDEPG